MFRREIYRSMARVLDALDAEVLARTSFRFGGGTCLALGHGEYRLSRDIDFVCSDPGGYAELRSSMREHGKAADRFLADVEYLSAAVFHGARRGGHRRCSEWRARAARGPDRRPSRRVDTSQLTHQGFAAPAMIAANASAYPGCQRDSAGRFRIRSSAAHWMRRSSISRVTALSGHRM